MSSTILSIAKILKSCFLSMKNRDGVLLKFSYLIILILNVSTYTYGQQQVTIINNSNGIKLQVNNSDFIINGMNWDYFPIGTNFEYSLWNQSDDFIQKALDTEMKLLKKIGVNSIRVYKGIQPKWITYIYNKYGIYTMINHPFGRYGVSINGNWVQTTDYSKEEVKKQLLLEVKKLVQTYKNTEGLLLYLLGNENNYGLFWAGAETEDFPTSEQEKNNIGKTRGRAMYVLMNEAAKTIKSIDTLHPVAICNGDMLFIDIIAQECKDIDIYGTNMYRGLKFREVFKEVKDKLNKPILFTEFGADAYDAIKKEENQETQAQFLISNWKDIYQHTSHIQKGGNAIGGFTFQFSDGWWKYGQTKNLSIHDTHASWGNGGYAFDYLKGKNNMNEEWFGICAKGKSDKNGHYKLYPRAAYYTLKKVHLFNPYKKKSTIKTLDKHFEDINIQCAIKKSLLN